MAGLLTPSLAEDAFAMIRPQIEAFLASQGFAPNLAFAITATAALRPADAVAGSASPFYLVAALGNKADWPADLEALAMAKAAKSARTDRDSADLPAHYLLAGDTLAWGSVVLDDIVVACSGIKPWFDEMLAMWLAATVKALCKQRLTDLPAGTRFLD